MCDDCASTYFMGKDPERVSRIIFFTMFSKAKVKKKNEMENSVKIECTLTTRFNLMRLSLLSS